MTKRPKTRLTKSLGLDSFSAKLLIALLVLSAILGVAGFSSGSGGPAATASAGLCATQARIDDSAEKLVRLTAAVTAAEIKVAKAKEALAAAGNSTSTAISRILRTNLARANVALKSTQNSLKIARAAHAKLVARSCKNSGGGATTTPSTSSLEYVSSSATRTNGSVEGDSDSVEFRINFKVTAIGGDVYLDGDAVMDQNPTTATDGLAWSVTDDSNTGTSTYTAIVTANDGYKSSDTNTSGDKRFKIMEGSSRNFTFTVSIPTGRDIGVLGVQLNGFKWGTVSADMMANLYTNNISDFRTDLVTGLIIH